MDRKAFNDRLRVEVASCGNVTSIHAAIQSFAFIKFSLIENQTQEQYDEFVEDQKKTLRSKISMDLYGDIRELLFGLQRTILKEDKYSKDDVLSQLRGIIDYLPE